MLTRPDYRLSTLRLHSPSDLVEPQKQSRDSCEGVGETSTHLEPVSIHLRHQPSTALILTLFASLSSSSLSAGCRRSGLGMSTVRHKSLTCQHPGWLVRMLLLRPRRSAYPLLTVPPPPFHLLLFFDLSHPFSVPHNSDSTFSCSLHVTLDSVTAPDACPNRTTSLALRCETTNFKIGLW